MVQQQPQALPHEHLLVALRVPQDGVFSPSLLHPLQQLRVPDGKNPKCRSMGTKLEGRGGFQRDTERGKGGAGGASGVQHGPVQVLPWAGKIPRANTGCGRRDGEEPGRIWGVGG